MRDITFLNKKLPERSMEGIAAFLEASQMPAKLPEGIDNCRFNCWGFTAFYLGWEERAYWMDRFEMVTHLDDHTFKIAPEEVQTGDIAVFYHEDDDYLTHTAMVIDGGDMVCHKPGSNPLCVDTLEAASKMYGRVTYVRELEKKFKPSELAA